MTVAGQVVHVIVPPRYITNGKATPQSAAYCRGALARHFGRGRDTCPYERGGCGGFHAAWVEGYAVGEVKDAPAQPEAST